MNSMLNRAAAANHGRAAKRKKQIIVAVAAVAVLLLAVFAGVAIRKSNVAATIDGSKYQAVFFTSGQVYFGKLSKVNNEYFRLTDVFYVQASNEQAESTNPEEASAGDIRLIKLGSEVHAPDDEMIISKDQVLFFENLKKDGKVTDSITKYNEEKN